jgi:hypothetical protein
MMDATTKLPLFGIPAAIYVAATLFLAVLYGINDYKQGIASGITLLLGLIVYPFFQRRIDSSAARVSTVEADKENLKDNPVT